MSLIWRRKALRHDRPTFPQLLTALASQHCGCLFVVPPDVSRVCTVSVLVRPNNALKDDCRRSTPIQSLFAMLMNATYFGNITRNSMVREQGTGFGRSLFKICTTRVCGEAVAKMVRPGRPSSPCADFKDDVSLIDTQDASPYANSNATDIRARMEMFGGDVTVSFGYANALLVLAVLYLAWEQGYMLASRLLACQPAKIKSPHALSRMRLK